MYRTGTKLLALMLVLMLLGGAVAGEGVTRKVKSRVEPVYPDLARQHRVEGTVRIEVVIAANGAVKSTRVLGGHPLLVQSAETALKRWRYEPGPETTVVVEFHFHEN